jgi:hypothetical protein
LGNYINVCTVQVIQAGLLDKKGLVENFHQAF